VDLAENGAALDISLRTGRRVPVGDGDLRVERWVAEEQRTKPRRFPWRVRVTVPGGGLQVRKDLDMAFVAPEGGYVEAYEHREEDLDNWRFDHSEHFWLKLKDGTYARIKLRIAFAYSFVCVFESCMNPTPGSRVLEYDKKLRINPPKY
jgi:hypothetical protein